MILKVLLIIFSILTTNQEAIVLDEINEARQEAGIHQLITHRDYTRVAQIRAADIAVGWVPFSHYAKRNVWNLIRTPSSSIGEALGRARGIEYIVPNLLDSPSHRRLLMKNTHVGIATTTTQNGFVITVIIIGHPVFLRE